MKSRGFASILSFLLVPYLAPPLAHGEIPESHVRQPFLLTPEVAFSSPPPPTPGSPEEAADFMELHHLQNTRTAEECKAADAQAWYSARTLSGVSAGLLSESEFAIIEDLVNRLMDTAVEQSGILKARFDRARPYITDPSLTPCVRKPRKNDRAYPSGHALGGLLVGRVLGQLFPARAAEFEKWGRQVGLNRIIGGVHHPSDVQAGWLLAEEVLNELPRHSPYVETYRVAAERISALGGRCAASLLNHR